MLRLGSMIVMLAVLVLLISRAADPRTWTWLTGEHEAAQDPKPATSPVATQPPKSEPESVTPGPTDTDPDEREGAREQFQALSDGSTELGREEMPAYWRLFAWTDRQSFAQMSGRATSNVVLNQFIQTPDEQRGQLIRLDLNIRRVLAYDAPANSAGVKKVYEIWGWTTESKAWLYCVLTAHLPPGMPTGPDVYEHATFVGYFLKVQGYHAAGAAPKDKPLMAPLLIGRLAPPVARPVQPANDFSWIGSGGWLWWIVVLALIFAVLRLGLSLTGGPRQRVALPEKVQEAKTADLRGWLAGASGDGGENEGYNGSGGLASSDGAAKERREQADFRDN
jgi:hypothetical protein